MPANEATRARTVDETSVSREQNRQQDEGGIRSGSGPGRPGTEQEGGAPAVAAIPGRAPGMTQESHLYSVKGL